MVLNLDVIIFRFRVLTGESIVGLELPQPIVIYCIYKEVIGRIEFRRICRTVPGSCSGDFCCVVNYLVIRSTK